MPNVEWASRRDESRAGRLVRHPGDGKARTLDRKVEPFFREPGLVPGTIEDVGMNRHGVLRTHGVGEARHLSIGAHPLRYPAVVQSQIVPPAIVAST